MVMVPARCFISQSHRTLVRANTYEGEDLGVVNPSALFETTPSAETLYSVHPVQSRLLYEVENVESVLGEIRSTCFVLGVLPRQFSASPRCRLEGSASYSGKSAR